MKTVGRNVNQYSHYSYTQYSYCMETVPSKLKNGATIWFNNLTLEYGHTGNKDSLFPICTDICTPMFAAAYFTKKKMPVYRNNLDVLQKMNGQWKCELYTHTYTHTRTYTCKKKKKEYYWAIKRRKSCHLGQSE